MWLTKTIINSQKDNIVDKDFNIYSLINHDARRDKNESQGTNYLLLENTLIVKMTDAENRQRKLVIPQKAKEMESEKKFNLTKFNKKEKILSQKEYQFECNTNEKKRHCFDANDNNIDAQVETSHITSKSISEESQNARKILENVFDKVQSKEFLI